MATDATLPDSTVAVTVPLPPAFAFPADWTLADLQVHLGGIPLNRILLWPPPGTATKSDVEAVRVRIGRTCELIDGVLVEKAVGYYESVLGFRLAIMVGEYLKTHPIGVAAGEAGFTELLPKQVRAADVSVVSWNRLPPGDLAADPIPALVPDFVAEVLSKSNTPAEMRRKRRDYFTAGVRLLWQIDPRTRTARSYTAAEQFVGVDENGTLSGGEVLPGFEVSLAELFAPVAPPPDKPNG